MPNRIIKESICTSEKINSLSDFHFRLWACLITYVDDFGRGDARSAIIKGRCFPLRERVTVKDIDAGLHVLADTGCIILYTVDGESYLCFPNWDKHQTVRNQKSKYPAPPEDENNLQAIESNCKQLEANVPVIQSNPNPNPNPNPKRFTPPSLQEVTDYCLERGNGINPQAFIDFYSSKGWKVGNQPMKDWKACVRTWEQRDRKPVKVLPAQDFTQRDYSDVNEQIMNDLAREMAEFQKGAG